MSVPFEFQPTLRGQLLTLRPLRADDFAEMYAVARDPLIWEQHPASNRYEPAVFRAFFDEAMQTGSAFAACDNRDGRIIGSSRYYGYDESLGEVEIGWSFLARAFWGGAYNGEMKQLMLDHAFRFVNQVVFLVGPNNVRSQRALAKIGAQRVGTRVNRRGETSVVFAISIEENDNGTVLGPLPTEPDFTPE